MDKDELVASIQGDFADLLNNSAIKTPQKAKRVADALLQQGVQPTWRLIREVLGTGSATTLQNVVNNYWAGLGKRLDHLEKRADVPDGLAKEFNRLWDKALKQAQRELEKRLATNFAEAKLVKDEAQQQLSQTEKALEQLQTEKIQQEQQWREEKKIAETTHQQLENRLTQQQQETKQLQKLYQQATAMSQHHQQQATQRSAILDTTKEEYQQATAQLRTEHQQVIERQAQQYESMINHYANELGQLKVRQEKNDKQQQKERLDWKKQQDSVTQQSSQLQIENAMLTQENTQFKRREKTLQQQVDQQYAMLLTLEKEQSTLQTRCLFIEESNVSLKEQLRKRRLQVDQADNDKS